ncbi:MAG: ABC transporter ATP-binding protein [Deltaproteobacteria bacterium]|nr:ABC transporter ATP-binding protein [Deltaproteobacteria bacterium]
MATIELKNISHSYQMDRREEIPIPQDCNLDQGFVIKDLSLTWEEGSANALLGPSGCGKTTILNIISGLLQPTIGQILYDGKDVTALSPEARHIAQVFQFPVIYDTMTVYKNLSFPLRNAGVKKSEIKRKVQEVAEILDLTHVLPMSAGKISQAEKQKVSLGRGIIRDDNVAILFDEPLTVIDPKEKYILQRKIREVQKNIKLTAIYVTHDQHEALTFADQVTVIKDGRMIQTGNPAQLHTDPQSPFIGYFIGSPGMNLLTCTLEEDVLDFGEFQWPLSPAIRQALQTDDPEFQFGIRPEFVALSHEKKAGTVPFEATMVDNIGSYQVVTLSTNGIQIKGRAPEDMRIDVGNRLWVGFPEESVRIFQNDKRVF